MALPDYTEPGKTNGLYRGQFETAPENKSRFSRFDHDDLERTGRNQETNLAKTSKLPRPYTRPSTRYHWDMCSGCVSSSSQGYRWYHQIVDWHSWLKAVFVILLMITAFRVVVYV